MKKNEFIACLSERINLSISDTTIFLSKAQELITESLMIGEPVNLDIGRFFPLMFSRDYDMQWVDGDGPLSHVSNRNRDRVIAMFEWDKKTALMITDYSPTEGSIGDKIRLASKNRTRRIIRSNAYKSVVFARARKGS